jgi:hypothetical protein
MHTRPSSPDPEFLASLTCQSRLELGAYETSPRTARGHIARVLEEWSLAEFREVASLIASELITHSLLEIAQGCGQSCFCCSQVWCEAEQGEEQGAVVFGVADGGGDAVVAGLADEAH